MLKARVLYFIWMYYPTEAHRVAISFELNGRAVIDFVYLSLLKFILIGVIFQKRCLSCREKIQFQIGGPSLVKDMWIS